MAVRIYVNNVTTRLTAQLLTGGTTANVTAGDGALFAAADGTDWIIGTLRRMSGYKDVAREIVKITNRSTDALTITRAQESTSALQFEVGDVLDADVTAADLTSFLYQTSSTWTPAITCLAPGDLSVAYSTQLGFYTVIGDQVIARLLLVTSSFTHTTASGGVRISGLPFTSANVSQQDSIAALRFSGFTSAGFVAYALIPPNVSYISIRKSGSAAADALADITDFPSAGSVILGATIIYPKA